MNPLRGLFDHASNHHAVTEMPARIRRRMYRALLDLVDEEERVRQLLDLPIPPRLSVVDEDRVAILRPAARQNLGLDAEYRLATDERERAR